MMLYQNVVKSLSLPSIIVHMGDDRKNRRPKANSYLTLPGKHREYRVTYVRNRQGKIGSQIGLAFSPTPVNPG